ncbi:hypothetical protein MKX01_004387 [Papaver californicum]|nr:hypothetical protein MKX01_004387 [Papaver californicum]
MKSPTSPRHIPFLKPSYLFSLSRSIAIYTHQFPGNANFTLLFLGNRRSPKSRPFLPKNQNNQFRSDKSYYESGEARFNGASFSGAVFNLSTTIVGAGIMGLPATICFFLGDVMSGTRLSSGMVHHSGVLEGWFGTHWWTSPSAIPLFIALTIISPLISFKRLHLSVYSLRYTSAVSVALAVYFVSITTGTAFAKFTIGGTEMPRLFPKVVDQASFWKLFTTVPVLVTAYICHYSIHPIENELKDPSEMKFNVQVSLTLCASVYVLASLFGLLLFGELTMDDVLANFDADLGLPNEDTVLNDVVRLCYGIHLILAFPVVFFSLRLGVDGLLFPTSVPIGFDNRRFLSISVCLLGIIFIGATFTPNIWIALQFTGAAAATSLGFIFPAAIVLKDQYGIATKKDRMLSWFFIILAVSTSTIAISSHIYGIFKHQGLEIMRAEE